MTVACPEAENLCLKHATADIVLLADDDVQYQSHFVESILRVFDSVSCDVATFGPSLEPKPDIGASPYWHNIISILGVSSIRDSLQIGSQKKQKE